MEWSELRQTLMNWSGRIVRFTSIRSAASDGSCTVAGRSVAGGRAPTSIPSRLLSPFGIRSVPPADLDCVELRAQGSVYGSTTLPADTKQYGPSDVAADGSETVLYNAQNSRAIAANGPDVIVNEGGKLVATDTTPTADGTLSIVSAGPVAGLYTMTLIWTDNSGTPHTVGSWISPGAGVPGTVAITGKVSGGSPHFKAPGP